MNTVFDAGHRNLLIRRIEALQENNQAGWGKMNAAQMLRHCVLWEEMIHENKRYPRVFIGRWMGRFMLKKELQSLHMRKNNPSIPALIVSEKDIDFTREKMRLIHLLNSYTTYQIPDYDFIHPFFGPMSKTEIGQFAYKHLDHHLKQFEV